MIARFPQPLCPLWTLKVPIAAVAVIQFDRADDDATRQILNVYVIDAVFLQHLGLFNGAIAAQACVDVDTASNAGRTGSILNHFDATHNGFGMGLSDAQGTHFELLSLLIRRIRRTVK
jgi:hypothetical protein